VFAFAQGGHQVVACAELFDPVAALPALEQVLFQLPGLPVGKLAQQELFQFFGRGTCGGHIPPLLGFRRPWYFPFPANLYRATASGLCYTTKYLEV